MYWLDDWTVGTGVTLTIPANTIVKFSSAGLFLDGTLNASGTADSPVVFTSFKDDAYGGDTNGDGTATTPAPGDWAAIILRGGSLTLDHTIVQYGGGARNYGCATASLSGMITQHYYSCGWQTYSAQIDVRYSTLRYGASSAIYIGTGSGISIGFSATDSNIYSNSGFGVYNGISSIVLNAENNWWGSDSGPAPYGTGNGINYRTYTCGTPPVTCYDYGAYVDAVPWLTSSPTPPSMPDDDGDGLPNDWEINGYDANGDGTIDVDLAALGADPQHKDLFVEMDYMVRALAAHGLAPSSAVMSAVRIIFENAPVSNPDGTNGIRLHALLGNEVPYDANLGVATAECSQL